MDLTTGVRTPMLAFGRVRTVAVLLVHNVLLAARNVHVDDHLPHDATRLSRDALAALLPSVALRHRDAWAKRALNPRRVPTATCPRGRRSTHTSKTTTPRRVWRN